eukprot:scaffold1.g5459.t1
MKAVEFHGTKDFRVNEVGRLNSAAVGVPLVTDPHDAIIRVTSTCICGSDLHMYVGAMPGLKFGDIMGHEFMGIITDVGEEVQGFKVGDRVVAAFDIACGSCFFCKHQNLLKVDPSLCDEAAVLLSDILPTAWHGCELAGVGRGDRVAIWGAGPGDLLEGAGAGRAGPVPDLPRWAAAKRQLEGSHQALKALLCPPLRSSLALPVGILAAHCAFARDASRVVLIDEEQVCTSWLHWFETALKLETDPSEMLNELIYACRKARALALRLRRARAQMRNTQTGGRIGVIGVYAGYTNHFNIGAFMEKGLTMAAGQCPVQKYWKRLQEMVKAGDLHPEIVVSHKMPLTEAPRAYRIFNDKARRRTGRGGRSREEGCIKVVLKPEAPASGTAREQEPRCDSARVQAVFDGGAPLVDGYAPFCKHVFLPAAFLSPPPPVSALPITPDNRRLLESGYTARRTEELAVTPPPAAWLDVILYSREQLVKELVALPYAEGNPEPITMLRNALGREEGGSGVPLDRGAYERAVAYWQDHAAIQ